MLNLSSEITNIEIVAEEVDVQASGITTMISLQCRRSIVHFVDLASVCVSQEIGCNRSAELI